MPPEDLAFPKGVNSMKRQTAIRVFAILTFLDVVTANNKLSAYVSTLRILTRLDLDLTKFYVFSSSTQLK